MFTLKELFAIVAFLAIVCFCMAKATDTSVAIVFVSSIAMVVLVNVLAVDSFRATYVIAYVCLVVAVVMANESSIPQVNRLLSTFLPPLGPDDVFKNHPPGMAPYEINIRNQNRKSIVLSSLLIAIPYLSARIRDAVYQSKGSPTREGN